MLQKWWGNISAILLKSVIFQMEYCNNVSEILHAVWGVTVTIENPSFMVKSWDNH
jgi:hypothetical protein